MEVVLPLDVLERERSVYLLLVYDSPADGGGLASIARELVVPRERIALVVCATSGCPLLRSVGSVGVTKREKAQRTTRYPGSTTRRESEQAEAFGGQNLCAPTQERELLTRRSLAKMPLFGRGHRRLGKH